MWTVMTPHKALPGRAGPSDVSLSALAKAPKGPQLFDLPELIEAQSEGVEIIGGLQIEPGKTKFHLHGAPNTGTVRRIMLPARRSRSGRHSPCYQGIDVGVHHPITRANRRI